MTSPTAATRGLALAALFCIAGAPVLVSSQETPGDSSDPLDNLSQGQLQEAFRVLSRHYIEHDSLTYEQLNKAALEGLMRRLSFGAELVPREAASKKDEVPFAFHEEMLTEGVAYLRPVTFNEEEISRSRTFLKTQAKSPPVHTLILDLRAPVAQFEFARAAAFADLFTGRNQLLFKINKPEDAKARLFLSKEDNLWTKRLIVLIDRETSSVAETVAAILDEETDCLIIGEKTPGRAVQYQEIPLNQETNLRFASAQVLLPGDKPLFRKGVSPDLSSVTPSKQKLRIFEESEEKGLARYAFDKERPRMNEAALVSGTDPELDYYLLKSAGKTSPFDRKPLQDRSLQTALESLVAIDFLKLPEVAEKKKDNDKAEEEPGADTSKEKDGSAGKQGKDEPGEGEKSP